MSLEHWSFDPKHSRIGFHVRYLMITNVHGRFEKWDGELQFDPDDPARSRVTLTIDAASVDTREPQRDAHLRSPEFFDVERHPTISFEATDVERMTLDDYAVGGNLTIRGVTRRVVLDVSRSQVVFDQFGKERAGFEIRGTISRKEFGLTWNFVLETGGVMVGDRVTLTVELQAIRVPEKAAGVGRVGVQMVDRTQINAGEAFAAVRVDMPAIPAISSGQWLARIGLVVVLAASELVLPALFGAGPVQMLVLACTAVIYALSYLLTPSPGHINYDPSSFRPVLAMRASSLVAAAVTGGVLSPLLPLVAVPIAIAWTMALPRWRDLAFGLATLAVLLVPLHPALSNEPFSGTEVAILAGWSTILAAWAIFRRVADLVHLQRAQATSLARIRESALADAESRRQGMGSMTTKLAHELKNPLAAIKSLVQLESTQATDDKSRRRFDVVLGEVERIGTILREYLDLARPVVEARCVPIDLAELMSDVSALVVGRAEVAGIQLFVEGHGGSLNADARLLKEALVNVVCNAIEATPRGGTVSVSYERGNAGASIVVRDTGKGMTRDVAARVGTPYFTTREGGTGLGVVIAKTAVAQHGGTLEYQSTPGVGTAAKITLPYDQCRAAA